MYPTLLAAALGSAAAGCSPATTGSGHQPSPGQTGETVPALTGDDPLVSRPARAWQTARTSLVVPLPDPDGWHERNESGRLVVLDHPATSSVLATQAWYASERMDRLGCERVTNDVHERSDMPAATSEESLPIPEGFDTSVRLAVATSADGTVVAGALRAFGARGKQCFAYLFSTRATGIDAEQVVADRLAAMRTRSLERVALERDTDAVPREPLPALGPLDR